MTLIEVVISALLVALIAIGTLTGLIIANKATGYTRARAQATTLAQQNEERLRGEYVNTLTAVADSESRSETVSESGLCVEKVGTAWRYPSKATLELAPACEQSALAKQYAGASYPGTVFTVKSAGQFETPGKSAGSCETEHASTEVVKTTSQVTWTGSGAGKGVTESSLVKLPSNYSLLVKVINAHNEPVPGATVTVYSVTSGKKELGHQTTPTSGCVIFGGLESTVNISARKGDWVNYDSEPRNESESGPFKEATLSTASVTEQKFTIEAPGSIITEYETTSKQPVSTFTFVAASTEILNYDEIVGGSATSTSTAPELTNLFPMAYTVYAGGCTEDETTQEGGAVSAVVEPNKTKRVQIELPKVTAEVYKGKSASEPGTALASAHSASIIIPKCEGKTQPPGISVPYKFPAEVQNGALVQPYLPYGKELELCVDAEVESHYYKTLTKFANTAAGTKFQVYMKSVTKSTGAESC